jgi:hypothetical protein
VLTRTGLDVEIDSVDDILETILSIVMEVKVAAESI